MVGHTFLNSLYICNHLFNVLLCAGQNMHLIHVGFVVVARTSLKEECVETWFVLKKTGQVWALQSRKEKEWHIAPLSSLQVVNGTLFWIMVSSSNHFGLQATMKHASKDY